MQPFPNIVARFVSPTGTVVQPWIQYLQQFTQAPPPVTAVVVGASPFSYVAREPGNVIITGGTVTAVHLIRGSDDIDLTGQVVVPVSINDTVIVTYAVLPTMTFIPIYGAAVR